MNKFGLFERVKSPRLGYGKIVRKAGSRYIEVEFDDLSRRYYNSDGSGENGDCVYDAVPKSGERIFHLSYGAGTVIDVDDDEFLVKFDHDNMELKNNTGKFLAYSSNTTCLPDYGVTILPIEEKPVFPPCDEVKESAPNAETFKRGDRVVYRDMRGTFVAIDDHAGQAIIMLDEGCKVDIGWSANFHSSEYGKFIYALIEEIESEVTQ
jgi:hypothetical protein